MNGNGLYLGHCGKFGSSLGFWLDHAKFLEAQMTKDLLNSEFYIDDAFYL
jgi:hypothetical protein